MNNYVNVSWSDGYEDYFAEYDSNLVRVSGVYVRMTEDGAVTYITYTPNFFADDALLSLADAVVNSNKKVNKTHSKSELVETQPYPVMHFNFDLADGLEDLAEREQLADMGFVDDYYEHGDAYTHDELTKRYLPKTKPIYCLGIAIKYDKTLNKWTLSDGSTVPYPAVVCSKKKKPVLVDGMNAVINYLIRERNK